MHSLMPASRRCKRHGPLCPRLAISLHKLSSTSSTPNTTLCCSTLDASYSTYFLIGETMGHIEPGTYKIINGKSGTALTVLDGDGRDLVCWQVHGRINQQVSPT